MEVKTLRFLYFLPPFFRLTFKIGDVLPARIGACEARPGLAKCGGRKPHKGRSPTAVFWNPEGANSARSANRLLSDDCAAFFN